MLEELNQRGGLTTDWVDKLQWMPNNPLRVKKINSSNKLGEQLSYWPASENWKNGWMTVRKTSQVAYMCIKILVRKIIIIIPFIDFLFAFLLSKYDK